MHTDPATFKALIIDGQPLSQAQQDGRVTLTGDTGALLELLDALH
jgi:hypothetical protein